MLCVRKAAGSIPAAPGFDASLAMVRLVLRDASDRPEVLEKVLETTRVVGGKKPPVGKKKPPQEGLGDGSMRAQKCVPKWGYTIPM